MANQNSLYNKYSRYIAGGSSEHSDGVIEWWDRSIFQKDPSDIVYVVENFYVGRADLIANVYYGESRYWWVIAQYNNILDPFSEITAGRILLIPTRDRLSLMLSSKQGGVESTRESVNTISPIVI